MRRTLLGCGRDHVGFQGVADTTVPWVCSWLVVFDPQRKLTALRKPYPSQFLR